MNGIESLKVDCTKESKLLYSYYIEDGEITLTITKDAKGTELLKSITIDKTCDSSVLLNFSESANAIYPRLQFPEQSQLRKHGYNRN